jgi:hypothetical protein
MQMTLFDDDNLRNVLQKREQAKLIIEEQEEIVKEYNTALQTDLAIRGQKEAEFERWKYMEVEQNRTNLSKEKLLEQGVTLKQIEKATTHSTSRFIQVKGRKE